MIIFRSGWSAFYIRFHNGWWIDLKTPASFVYFSERYSYNPPLIKLGNWRLWVCDPILVQLRKVCPRISRNTGKPI